MNDCSTLKRFKVKQYHLNCTYTNTKHLNYNIMKRILLVLTLFIAVNVVSAQQWLNLNLSHVYNGEAFNYGQMYTDGTGNTIEITRVQYYLSGINLTHDGGQVSSLTDEYVLASGNVSFYSIAPAFVDVLEGISFDLGVDAAHNHLDPNSYPSSHPLAPKNPNMHWGWAAGYKFIAIEGNVDSNGDQVPDKLFQFHAVGDDNYLQNVSYIETTGSSNGSVLAVDLKVDIARWLNSVDLISEGTKHGVFPVNETIMVNTNTQVVFEDNALLDINSTIQYKNNIYFDYSQPYAPVIFYKLPKANYTSIEILDLQGRVLISEEHLSNEGNYFINRELNSGTYLAVFITDNNERITEKFIVRK